MYLGDLRIIMTVSKDLIIRCNECRYDETWAMSVLQHRKLKSVIKNAGFTKESESFVSPNKHYCPDCNDREKEVFHVYDGYGEEYLGEVNAWGIVDARQTAWDIFEEENVVKREKME